MNVTSSQYEELLERVRVANDNTAFMELVQRLQRQIISLVNGFRIAGLDKDDLYQECLISLRYSTIPKWRNTSPFTQHAYFTIRRHLLTLLRNSKSGKNSILNQSASLNQDHNDGRGGTLSLLENMQSKEKSALNQIASNENCHLLLQKLHRTLSPLEKNIMLLYLQQKSHDEIAAIIKTTSRKVAVAMFKVRTKARMIMKEQERKA